MSEKSLQVAVVGCLASQLRHLKEKLAALGLEVDLRGLPAGRAATVYPPGVDLIILTGFHAHRWDYVAYASMERRHGRNGRERVVRVHGISGAVRAIQAWLERVALLN